MKYMLIWYLGNQELGDENGDRAIQQQRQMVSPDRSIQNYYNTNNLAAGLSSFDCI